MTIRIAQFHQPATPEDGTRIMVDRYWPRTVVADPELCWRRDLAPSPELVAWFGRRPERWEEFKQRYRRELATPQGAEAVGELQDLALSGRLTLVTGARDRRFSAARALAELIDPTGDVTEVPTGHRTPLAPVPAWRRISLGDTVEWVWLIFGLLAPILVFISCAIALSYGRPGLIAVCSCLAMLTAAVLIRSTVRDNRRRQELQLGRVARDAEPIWAGFRDLGTSITGFAMGIGFLGGGLALASFLSRFHLP